MEQTMRRLGRFLWRATVAISLALTVLLLIVFATPLTPWCAVRLADQWSDAKDGVLIVLGADMFQDGMIGTGTYLRCLYAARAWKAGKFRAVVVAGGAAPPSPITTAAAMREYLVCQGVPREAVYVDERSGSTRQNALFVKEIVDRWPDRKVLLTSDYHIYRARRVFEKVGVPVSALPAPDIIKRFNSPLSRLDCFATVAVEWAKIVYYRMRGWM
jgi:uncharacterized SAM-binding protein YcdF (DUF218 family)